MDTNQNDIDPNRARLPDQDQLLGLVERAHPLDLLAGEAAADAMTHPATEAIYLRRPDLWAAWEGLIRGPDRRVGASRGAPFPPELALAASKAASTCHAGMCGGMPSVVRRQLWYLHYDAVATARIARAYAEAFLMSQQDRAIELACALGREVRR